MDEDIIVNQEIPDKPLSVRVIKEEETPVPSFDYDDYTPTEQEIQDIEKEIETKIKERTKNG